MRVHPVEALLLLDDRGAVLWADCSSDASRIPDSRDRWEAIWERRGSVAEIAHSHPGGMLAFSTEDETTMAAIDSALGRDLAYSIVTDAGVLRKPAGGAPVIDQNEPWWVALLRLISRMEPQ